MLSLFVHTTVVPTGTVISFGTKAIPFKLTSTVPPKAAVLPATVLEDVPPAAEAGGVDAAGVVQAASDRAKIRNKLIPIRRFMNTSNFRYWLTKRTLLNS